MLSTAEKLMPLNDNPSILIVGLGKTGLSCARFFQTQGIEFAVTDSRDIPPGLEALKAINPDVQLHTGGFDESILQGVGQIILSPGVALSEPFIRQAVKNGVDVIGDIELFALNADAPVVAIGGSNGKSTVTTLIGEMARQAGLNVQVGGNLGVPAMDLLAGSDESGNIPSEKQQAADASTDFYILELSSFQLETTYSLNACAAVVLNVSPDHMDRYASFADYSRAKQRVYAGDGVMVVNEDDDAVMFMCREELASDESRQVTGFTLGEPKQNRFGVQHIAAKDGKQEAWLAFENELLLPVKSLRIAGRHNVANALAALALGDSMDLPMADMLEALRDFSGLPHRMQWVADINGINWYNDSKGTNVGATVSAIEGMPGRKILIAGGDGKQADFSPLQEAVSQNNVVAVVLIGRDANRIKQALGDSVTTEFADTLEQAVMMAGQIAITGDSVILSPACASFDMFDSYEHRGQVFVDAVSELKEASDS